MRNKGSLQSGLRPERGTGVWFVDKFNDGLQVGLVGVDHPPFGVNILTGPMLESVSVNEAHVFLKREDAARHMLSMYVDELVYLSERKKQIQHSENTVRASAASLIHSL